MRMSVRRCRVCVAPHAVRMLRALSCASAPTQERSMTHTHASVSDAHNQVRHTHTHAHTRTHACTHALAHTHTRTHTQVTHKVAFDCLNPFAFDLEREKTRLKYMHT